MEKTLEIALKKVREEYRNARASMSAIGKEIRFVEEKMNEDNISHKEYVCLTDRLNALNKDYERLDIEQGVWDRARDYLI